MTPNAPALGCVSADELVALLEGALPGDRADALDAHVDGCASCGAVVAELGALADGTPRKVGRYLLERTLGVGGMGVVWAAWDPELQRRVAVKLVKPRARADGGDALARARMVREARSLARINHPNVVAVHDVGEHDGRVFVATELVDGETMARWQVGRGWREIVTAWVQAARGLAAAHAEGLVHRDVKPANVFVGKDGRVRVGDFGLARADVSSTAATPDDDVADDAPAPSAPAIEPPGAALTASGHVAGTPAYMAPEQRKGPVDARADQFALCVAIGEALSGRRPAADARPAIRDVPAALIDALERGLRADPAERFPTVAALADALGAVAVADAAARVPLSQVPLSQRAKAIGIAVVVIGCALFVTMRGHDAKPKPPGEPPVAISTPAPDPTPEPDPAPVIAPVAAVDPAPSPPPKLSRSTPRPTPPPPAPTAAIGAPLSPAPYVYPTFLDKAGQDAVDARLHEDPAGCLRSLGAVNPAEPHGRRVLRATCEMMAGRCADGSARIRAGFAPGQARDVALVWIELQYCPSADGDLTTRVRRFEAQAVNGSRLGYALDRYLGQLDALADDPDLATVKAAALPPADDGPTVVGKGFLRIVPHLRSIRRCDDAARLVAKAAAMGVNVPADSSAWPNCP